MELQTLQISYDSPLPYGLSFEYRHCCCSRQGAACRHCPVERIRYGRLPTGPEINFAVHIIGTRYCLRCHILRHLPPPPPPSPLSEREREKIYPHGLSLKLYRYAPQHITLPMRQIADSIYLRSFVSFSLRIIADRGNRSFDPSIRSDYSVLRAPKPELSTSIYGIE